MNHVRGEAGTYSLLSVYTSVGYAKCEVLLTRKPNTVGLGVIAVFPSRDDRLLFVKAELHRKIAIREMSGRPRATKSEGTIR